MQLIGAGLASARRLMSPRTGWSSQQHPSASKRQGRGGGRPAAASSSHTLGQGSTPAAPASPGRGKRPGQSSSSEEEQQAAALLATFSPSSCSRLTEGADVLLVLDAPTVTGITSLPAGGQGALWELPSVAPSIYATSSSGIGMEAAGGSGSSASSSAAAALAAGALIVCRLPASLALWPWRVAATTIGAGLHAAGSLLEMAGVVVPLQGGGEAAADDEGPAASSCALIPLSAGPAASSSAAAVRSPAGGDARSPKAPAGGGGGAAHQQQDSKGRPWPAGPPPAASGQQVVLRVHSQVLALWSDRLARELQRQQAPAALAAAAAVPIRVELVSSGAASSSPRSEPGPHHRHPSSPPSRCLGPMDQGLLPGDGELAPAADLPRCQELHVQPSSAVAEDRPQQQRQALGGMADGRPCWQLEPPGAEEWVPLAAAGEEGRLLDAAAVPTTLHVGGEPGVGPATWALALGLMYPTRPRPNITWANVEGLVRLAAHYESPLLLAACDDWLASPVAQLSARPGSPAFAWRWLAIADRVGLSQLVDRCLEYIACRCVQCPALREQQTLAMWAPALQPHTSTRLMAAIMAAMAEGAACSKRGEQASGSVLGWLGLL